MTATLDRRSTLPTLEPRTLARARRAILNSILPTDDGATVDGIMRAAEAVDRLAKRGGHGTAAKPRATATHAAARSS